MLELIQALMGLLDWMIVKILSQHLTIYRDSKNTTKKFSCLHYDNSSQGTRRKYLPESWKKFKPRSAAVCDLYKEWFQPTPCSQGRTGEILQFHHRIQMKSRSKNKLLMRGAGTWGISRGNTARVKRILSIGIRPCGHLRVAIKFCPVNTGMLTGLRDM